MIKLSDSVKRHHLFECLLLDQNFYFNKHIKTMNLGMFVKLEILI